MTELLDDFISEPPKNHLSQNPLVRRWLIAYCIFCVGATVVAAFEVETIIGSGPIGLIFALILKGVGDKHKTTNLLCWSMFALVLGCYLLIELANLGPSDAQLPIPIIMGVYTAGALMTTGMAISYRSR